MQKADAGLLKGFAAISVGALVALPGVTGGLAMPTEHGGWFYEYQGFFGALIGAAGAVLAGWLALRSARLDAERSRRTAIAGQNHRLIDALESLYNEVDKFFENARDSGYALDVNAIYNPHPDVGMINALIEARVLFGRACEAFERERNNVGDRASIVPVDDAANRLRRLIFYAETLFREGFSWAEIWQWSPEKLEKEAKRFVGPENL